MIVTNAIFHETSNCFMKPKIFVIWLGSFPFLFKIIIPIRIEFTIRKGIDTNPGSSGLMELSCKLLASRTINLGKTIDDKLVITTKRVKTKTL